MIDKYISCRIIEGAVSEHESQKRFHPPPQHNIWKPIAVFISVILIVVGVLYAFSDSKTLRASAASPCSIVVTPDWGKVPKEVVHLKDD